MANTSITLQSERYPIMNGLREITIIGNEDGIFVNGIEMKMMYNGIQLRFTEQTGKKVEENESKYIIFDDRSGSKMKIKEIAQQFKPFDKFPEKKPIQDKKRRKTKRGKR